MFQTPQRSYPRQSLELPLQFRILGSSNGPYVSSETENISQTGLFLRTHMHLNVGEPLSLSVQIPTYISGSHRFFFHCVGRVIHRQQLAEGQLGYGVKFEQALSPRQMTTNPLHTLVAMADPPVFVEKRRNTRHTMKMAASVRTVATGVANIEIPAETINVSLHGAFLATPAPLPIGTVMKMNLRPQEPAAKTKSAGQNFSARVIHTQQLADGTVGYGVEIDEALPSLIHADLEEPQIAWA